MKPQPTAGAELGEPDRRVNQRPKIRNQRAERDNLLTTRKSSPARGEVGREVEKRGSPGLSGVFSADAAWRT